MTDQARPRLTYASENDDPFVRQRSREAADAAQHVIDLEGAVRAGTREVAELTSRLNVFDEANKILHEQIEALTAKCEKLQHRNTVIMERLRASASLIVDLVRDPDEPYAPNTSAARLTAIADAAEPDQPQLSEEEARSAERFGKLFQPRTTGHDGG